MEKAFETVDAALKANGMNRLLSQASRLLVAFSGGADSTFLLLYLVSRYGNEKVEALHMNHQIRGKEAEEDMHHCESFCTSLPVKIHVESADVPAIAKNNGESTETAAREVRYGFFEEKQQKMQEELCGNVYVLTAHTADDQLETVLFHLLRGSGTRGMGGIPEKRGIFLRPLLCLGGEEIRQALDNARIAYVQDSTNSDVMYTRNYLRHAVIPTLKRIVPRPEKAAVRLARLCSLDDDYLSQIAAERLQQFKTDSGVPLEAFQDVHMAVSTRMLIQYHDTLCPNAPSVSCEQLKEMIEMIFSKKGTHFLYLPGGVRFVISAGKVTFQEKKNDRIEGAFSLGRNETISYGDYSVKASEIFEEKKTFYPILSLQTILKFDTMTEDLIVRSYRSGDTCRLFGMTKSVKKMYSEKKYTYEQKQGLPLICLGNEIVWVPGFPPCDGYRAGKNALQLIISKEK